MSDKQPSVPTVLILRHDQTAWNHGTDQDKIKGVRFDLPLTAKGQAKARKDAEWIAKQFEVASIRHSPMKRSRQSAEPLGKKLGLTLVEDKKLMPWDVGFVHGMTRAAAEPIVDYYIKHPKRAIRGGEPYEDFADAITGVAADEMARAEKVPYKARIVITHSDGIQAIIAFLEGRLATPHVESDTPPTGSISALERRGGKWTFKEDLAEG